MVAVRRRRGCRIGAGAEVGPLVPDDHRLPTADRVRNPFGESEFIRCQTSTVVRFIINKFVFVIPPLHK